MELMNSLPESSDRASPQEGLGSLSQVLNLGVEAHVSSGLPADGEEDFSLGDGSQIEGAPRDADSEHGLIGEPGAPSGPEGR